MRAIKYKVNRKALNNIYISSFWPILENAALVWDGCTAYEENWLAQIQYEAAVTVTWLTRSVSIDKLVKWIECLSLSDKLLFQKAVRMYKIINGLAPDYMSNIKPSICLREQNTVWETQLLFLSLVEEQKIILDHFPSSVDYWNKLPLSVRSADSLRAFNNYLRDLYSGVLKFLATLF